MNNAERHRFRVFQIQECLSTILKAQGLAPVERKASDRNIYKQSTELALLAGDQVLVLDVPDYMTEPGAEHVLVARLTEFVGSHKAELADT